jgi:hypothetical protein
MKKKNNLKKNWSRFTSFTGWFNMRYLTFTKNIFAENFQNMSEKSTKNDKQNLMMFQRALTKMWAPM